MTPWARILDPPLVIKVNLRLQKLLLFSKLQKKAGNMQCVFLFVFITCCKTYLSRMDA